MANAPQPTLRLDEAGEPRRLGPQPLLRRWRARLTALAWFVLIVLVLGPFFREQPYPTTPGQVARARIPAPRKVEVSDPEATNAALNNLATHQTQIWQRDVKAEERIQQNLRSFFDDLSRQGDQLRSIEQLKTFADSELATHNIAIDISTIQALLAAPTGPDPMTLNAIQRELRLIVINALFDCGIVSNRGDYKAESSAGVLRLMIGGEEQKKIPEPNLVLGWPEHTRSELANAIEARFSTRDSRRALRQACLDLLMSILEPNIVYDPIATRKLYEEQRAGLLAQPIKKTFNRDEPIVEQGAIISPLEAEALSILEAQRHQTMALKYLGLISMTAIFFAAIAIYLKRFRREFTLDASTITLHVLPPMVALVVGQVLLIWQGQPTHTVMIWFPAGLVGMLSSLLIAPQVAFVLVLTTACLFGFSAALPLQFMIIALFGGFTAVLASRNIRSRLDILSVGMKVGVVNMVALTIMALADPNWLVSDGGASSMTLYARLLASGFLNGIACSLATLVLLIIFEWSFGIVTDLRLLELTGMKHPLIRQLEAKAPGTYQHTLNVSKLAEAAAEAIGANTLLVRAGTYFHDVGKMVKPKYFSENQVTLDDKKAHARLSPYMSVLIIKNHVKEGQELARAFGLPQKIIDFIPQHHGTGLIRYFYQEALKRYENSEAVDPVREEDFRYPGPKPQSIEAAIVLLADSVDAIATSRFTGAQVNESELRRHVQLAIGEKFNDGQFDECNLTMSHLYRIREALVAALMARFHFRIAYPTPPKPPREAAAAPTQITVSGPGGS
ncbi:HDIG domain-containing protein [bacterium]|nr:HDIG domain-containing protein [bacterium]